MSSRLYSVFVAAFAPLSLAAQQTSSFSVGSATAAAGSTAYGAIAVPAGVDSGVQIPVAVIRGLRPGPTVAFVAGSHGTEYTSIIAMQRLISRVDPRKLAGTVIVAPLLNVPSFETMTPHVNPIDRKGMNGAYPGDPNGTQTARALAAVTEQIVAPADVVVDLHGGDLDEDLRPYSYWFRGGRAAQDSAGLRLALAFGLDHIIVTDVDPSSPTAGRSLSGQALVRGKTVLVAEAGRSGIVAPLTSRHSSKVRSASSRSCACSAGRCAMSHTPSGSAAPAPASRRTARACSRRPSDGTCS
jgi:predicted deacylase